MSKIKKNDGTFFAIGYQSIHQSKVGLEYLLPMRTYYETLNKGIGIKWGLINRWRWFCNKVRAHEHDRIKSAIYARWVGLYY